MSRVCFVLPLRKTLLLAAVLTASSCSKRVVYSSSLRSGYQFPGVEGVTPNADGTFTVTWAQSPVRASAIQLFSKEGNAQDPDGANVAYDFSRPAQEFRDGQTSFVTPRLTLAFNTCFIARLAHGAYRDANLHEVCTRHQRFVFAGLESLSEGADGEISLRWSAVPDDGVTYSVFSRANSPGAAYDFAKEPLLKTTQVTATLPAPVPAQARCYLVRFESPASRGDSNAKEFCTTLAVNGEAPRPEILAPVAAVWVRFASSMTVSGRCEEGFPVTIAGGGVLHGVTTNCASGSFSALVDLSAGEGIKELSASQTDDQGRTGTSPSVTIHLDTVAPQIVFGSPSASQVNSLATVSIPLSFSDSDGSGMASMNLVGSDVSLATTGTATCAKTLAGSGLTSRTVTLSACSGNGTVAIVIPAGIAVDSAGNESSAAGPGGTVVVDNTAPAPVVAAPLASSWVRATSGVVVSGSCETGLPVTLGGSGVLTGATTACSGGAFSASVTLVSGEGAKAIAASQTDGSGNLGTSPSVTIGLDTVPPLVTLGGPSASAVDTSGSATVAVSVSDVGGSGVASVSLAPGDVTLTTTGTATCAKAVSGSGTDPRTVTLSACTGDGTVAVGVSSGRAVDLAGNSSLSAGPSSAFSVDNTAPAPVIQAPAAASWVKSASNLTVSGSCETGLPVTVAGSGVQTGATPNCVGGAFSSTVTLQSGDGSKVITASQTDGLGHVGTSPSVTISLDTQVPTVSLGSPSSSLVDSSGTVTFAVSFADVGGSGVASVNLTAAEVTLATTGTAFCSKAVSGSGTSPRTVTLSNCSGDGTVAIGVSAGVAADTAGNTSAITGPSATFSVDNLAPTPLIQAPVDGGWVNSASNVTVSGACEAGYTVTIAGSGVQTGATPACVGGSFSATVTLTAAEGPKAISASQTDGSSNTGTSPLVTVTLDTQTPTVSLGSPSSAQINSLGTVTVDATFSDAGGSGVANVSLVPGDVTLSATGTAACSKAVSGSGLASRTVTLSGCSGDGTVTISLSAGRATDTAGNASLAAGPSAAFTVDNSAPVLTTLLPVANTKIKDNFTLTGDCEGTLLITVTGAGISGSPQTTSCSANAYSLSLTLTGSDGNNTLTVAETDAAANTSSVNLTLVRDTTAPVLAISAPANAAVFNDVNVPVALEGSCESGLTVTIEGDVPGGQTTSCTAGSFSFATWQLSGVDGAKSVTVSQTDSAGNKGTAARSFTLDTTPVPVGSAPALSAVSTVVGLHFTLSGTCDSDAAYSTSATTTMGRIVATTCSSSALTIKMTDFPHGRNPFTVTVTTTRVANGTTRSTTANLTQQFLCPTNYVGIPGRFSDDADVAGLGSTSAAAGNVDAGLDPTRDFCIMKYPAKAATSNNGGQNPWEPAYDGNKSFAPLANYWPESRASGTPWVNITRDEARDRCRVLNEAFGHCSGAGCGSTFDITGWGYRLPSNTQWQMIARNLESTAGNWTGGSVGVGYLWRGHSDNGVGSNTDLFAQTFSSASNRALSHPRSDAGVSDYFGTGNSSSQNSSGTSGWQERRRFVVSNGLSLWDVSGNVRHWVYDTRGTLGISGADDTAGLASSSLQSFLNGGSNRFSAAGNLLFGNKGTGGLQYTEAVNAGTIWGGSGGTVHRGAYWSDVVGAGLFSTLLNMISSTPSALIGFRCAFVPPPPADPVDTGNPSVSVQRVDGAGAPVANSAVTIAGGGFWNLGISYSDPENTGVNSARIWVQVRRKVAGTDSDFPTSASTVYREGYLLSSLMDETAWVQQGSGQYVRNDGTYINYLITAIDPAGNTASATISVQNTQSCPPGYVGVPGAANIPGLGNVNASMGNSHAQLDPTRAFCMMKYPAKVQSAGTTVAQTTVGGLFEPIMKGNGTFTNLYNYADGVAFDAKIKYLPESRFSGTPWVSLSRDDSIAACQALQMQFLGTMPDTSTGGGFQLISNTEWQVTARNIEAVNANWSNNGVGNGVLAKGHTDNVISYAEPLNSWCIGCTDPSTSLTGIPQSWADSNSYFATGAGSTYAAWNTLGASPAAGAEQKRTQTLSNGAVVWDMGGNVWQWVRDNNTDGSGTSGDMGISGTVRAWVAWKEFSDVGLTVSDKLLFSSAGNYTSTKNAGQIYGDSQGAVRRGGNWSSGGVGGLFATSLNTTGSGNTNIGFRCVFVP